MPNPPKWKLVGGTVSAAFVLSAGVAQPAFEDRGPWPRSHDLQLTDTIAISEVTAVVAPAHLAAAIRVSRSADDSLSSPFDIEIDTDGDGFSDGTEILAGTGPLDATSFPQNNFACSSSPCTDSPHSIDSVS